MIFKNIDLDDIDFNDRYFQLQNHRDKLSAFTTDMVPYFPIYLQPNGKGQFRVIDGFLVSAQVVNENLSNSIPALELIIIESTMFPARTFLKVMPTNLEKVMRTPDSRPLSQIPKNEKITKAKTIPMTAINNTTIPI